MNFIKDNIRHTMFRFQKPIRNFAVNIAVIAKRNKQLYTVSKRKYTTMHPMPPNRPPWMLFMIIAMSMNILLLLE